MLQVLPLSWLVCQQLFQVVLVLLQVGDGAGKLVEWDLAAAKLRARPVETLPGMVTSVELDNVTRLALESRSER